MRISHRLVNFKAFEDTGAIRLAPVTVLCGENSSGKSSILKSILLVKQSSAERRSQLLRDAPLQPLLFNGELTRLGSWTDTVHGKARDTAIRMQWRTEGFNREIWRDLDVRSQRVFRSAPEEKFSFEHTVEFRSRLNTREELSTFLSKSSLTSPRGQLDLQPFGDQTDDQYFMRIGSIKSLVTRNMQISNTLRYYDLHGLSGLLQGSPGPMETGAVRITLNGPFISSIRPVLDHSWVPFFERIQRLIRASRSNIPGAKPRWHKKFDDALTHYKRDTGSDADATPNPATHSLLGLAHAITGECTLVYEHSRATLAPLWKRVRYLGPLRHQPQRFYQFDDTGGVDIGVSGEFTVQVLALEQDNEIVYSPVSYLPDGTQNILERRISSLLEATNYWLEAMDLPKVTPNSLRQSLYELKVGQLEVALPDVGFGVSQVLPIIVESLRASDGDTVILEQPEIHLHPRVQAVLADFFLARSRDGIKFLIESHSEYMVKRLCRRIAESKDEDLRKDVNVSFVGRALESNSVTCEEVRINEYGEIENWPKGFFDTSEDLYWTKASLSRRMRG